MLRSDCLHAIQGYLQANYSGPVIILRQEDDAELEPPYAIVRIGSAEDIGMGQVDIWDFNVIVAVFHDADASTIEAAEAAAAEVFASLQDPAAIITYLAAQNIVASAWVALTSEAGRDETRWQHFAGFRLIASPPTRAMSHQWWPSPSIITRSWVPMRHDPNRAVVER